MSKGISICILSFAVIIFFAGPVQAQSRSNPDFSGDWQVNTAESTKVQGMTAEALTRRSQIIVRIDHHDPEFRIRRISPTNGAVLSDISFYTDGREISPDGTDKLKTFWDKATIVAKRTRAAAKNLPTLPSRKSNGEVVIGDVSDAGSEIRIEWSLSPDGARLTEVIRSVNRYLRRLRPVADKVTENKSESTTVYDRVKH